MLCIKAIQWVEGVYSGVFPVNPNGVCRICRIQSVLLEMPVDPSMSAALPPGAWWDAANSGVKHVITQPYGPAAGDAAVMAARGGALELRNVHFAYPLRPDTPGLPSACS